MNRLKYFFYLLLLLLNSVGWSQLYPVQVNSSVFPPYLSSLSSYATTVDQKYLVNIYTADLNVVHRQVRLQLYIEGNGIQAQSLPMVQGAPIMYLNGGETLQLSNLDLAPYFQLENLSGINQNQYSSTLPQGNYKYCIEVYDFITNQRISQKSCTFYYFVYNEPPLLNSPSNHELVGFQEPQNLIFTWTPRHLNAVNIEYEFELVELLDQQVPSNHAFLTSIPLYKTTTSTTVLHYGPVEPQLIAGRKYAWRVKALSQPGFGDKAIFNNNGYSEIFDFIYPGNCPPPKFVVAISLNATQSKITWQTNPDFVDYKIEYRKKGTNSWYPTAYYNNEAKLYDLEAGATYEYRVGGECIGGLINYTPVEEFTQPRKEEIAIKCGIKPNIDLSNTTLFEGELPNDQIILAGDFSIKLTEVRGKRSYSGKGYVNVPYLSFVKIGVEFKDITLNTDFRLVKGEIKALYDPSWKNIIDLSSLYDQIEDGFDLLSPDTEEHQFQTNFDIPDLSHITVNSNEVVVTGTNGQTQSFDLDPKELIIIRDPKGNVYAVPPGSDKPVVLNEGQAAGFIPDASNTQGITSAGMVTKLAPIAARVTFERSAESKYADDVMPAKAHPDIQKLYKTIADGATPYTLYHKGIQNEGKGSRSFDFIDAVIAVNGTTIKPESILFNIKGSVAKKIGGLVMKNGKAYQRLEVPVYHSSTPEELLALIPGKDGAKHQVLGAAKIIPIKTQTDVNITLVPVNNATIPDGIATQLNAIYADAGVQFKVTIAPNHEVAKNTLECGKDALLEKLSEDQSQFVEQYKAGKDIQKDQYYVFVTKGITPSRAISGFMPRHSQFGFVFTNQSGEEVKAGNDLATIIGHELGHGVFELQHPWEQFSTGDKNSNTPWLMDYALGTKLAYPHWQRISHPKFGVYVLDGSEKGEFSKSVMTPNFKIVNIDQSSIVLEPKDKNIPTGTVPGFVVIEKDKEIITKKRYYYWDQDRYVNTTSLSWNNEKNKFETIANSEPIFGVENKTNDPEILFFLNLIDCPARKLFLNKSKLPTNYNSNKVLADFLASKLNSSLPLECNPLDNSKPNQITGWSLAKDDTIVSCNIADDVVIKKQLLNIAEAVNKSNNTIKDLEPIFRANITLCSMQKMEESLRTKILSKYFKEATDDSDLEISMCENSGCDYFFIGDLIKYTPNEQRLNLLLKFKENNFVWLKKLYNFGRTNGGFGNDIDINQVSEVYLELSKWIVTHYDKLNIKPTVKQAFVFDGQAVSDYYPGMKPYVLGKDNEDIVLQIDNNSEINIQKTELEFLEDGKLRFFNKYMMTDLSPRIYDPNNPPPLSSYYSYFEYDENYNPYEPVTVICGIENKLGLETKKEIVMPAIAAFAYQAILDEEGKQETLRQFGNAVMITTGVLAVPFSGGSSLVGVLSTISSVGIAVGSIDAYVTSLASSDPSFKDSSFYKAWDTTYTAYSFIDGAGAVTNLANTGYNILKLSNFAKSYNAFDTAISSSNLFKNTVFTERLSHLKNIFKNTSADLNLLNRGKTFSNYISKINTGFKKTILASVLTLNLNVNATDNILQLSNNANKIETVLNLSGKTEQLTDVIRSTITSKSDEILKAFDNEIVVSIKTSPTAQAVDGKFVILNVGQDNILATLINNQVKINFIKSAVDGYHIYEFTEDKDPTNTNTSPKCTFCPDKIGNSKESELCKKLEKLASNTQNAVAVQKLCDKGINLKILDKVLSYTIAKQKVFVDDFSGISEGGMAILKSKEHLVDYWKENGDFYKTIRPYHGEDHRDWDTSSKIVKSMGAREKLLVEAIDYDGIHSQKKLDSINSNENNGSLDAMKVSSGNLPNGNIIVKYNRKQYHNEPLEKSDIEYNNFTKTLHPFLQKHIEYMDFIRKDCSSFSDGKLYEKLYGGKITLGKLNNAQRPGIHTEVLVLNELIKDKQNITSVADIRALDIKIVIRWKVNKKSNEIKHMVTCPHCFYITEGVFFPNSK
ncbi:fibronectin type III domain-containing protein [Flavobacterium covae]|uniref:fibronectin type III domain-containing protein n=4 Tax=Flavobacterium covae TaxID=2906076 RepID=UPI000745CBE3|nr:fibronectin type III domain-containing protein [Flavobacterium covae]AMA48123.1 hypothetical protein AWN65_00915 [Flavobacterium covae]